MNGGLDVCLLVSALLSRSGSLIRRSLPRCVQVGAVVRLTGIEVILLGNNTTDNSMRSGVRAGKKEEKVSCKNKIKPDRQINNNNEEHYLK